jgi:BNR/Asp-box repeat
MQNKSHPQPPRPGPDCASFVDDLPLLDVNALEEQEAARLRAHLETCVYCQTQRAAYDLIDVALRRTFSTQEILLVSAEDMMAMTNEEQWAEVPTFAVPDLAESGAQTEFVSDSQSEESSVKFDGRGTMKSMHSGPQSRVKRTSVPVSPRRHSVFLRMPLAAVAAVMVVGLLAATFVVFSHRPLPPVGAAATPTPAPTLTPQPPQSWSTVASLTTTTSFANALPAISPSDPRIVYEVTTNPQPALRRTADGGATWQMLPLPVQNASLLMQLYVSPLNPNVVVLHTDGYISQPSSCNTRADAWTPTSAGKPSTGTLAVLSPASPRSGTAACTQFLSTDGGKSWTQTSAYFDNARIIQDGAGVYGIFMVQGNRLYTYDNFTCTSSAETYVCSGGLLVSLDGGVTWQQAPIPAPASFCGVGMAPTGTVMFAITSSDCVGDRNADNTIWRSDDAGAHWIPMSHLQFSFVNNLLVVPNSGAAYPTVYLTTASNSPIAESTATIQAGGAPFTLGFQISQDGGKTWSAVPTEGIPAGWPAGQVIAQTSSGSAIALFGPANSPVVNLYSWQPRSAGWQLVAPVPPEFPTLYLVTPGQGSDTMWAVSESQVQHSGTLWFTYTVYRLQL